MTQSMFTEANPDKGTKTYIHCTELIFFAALFTEANPDKGTKTMAVHIAIDTGMVYRS